MEKKHKERLRERFGSLLDGKIIIVLDISDDYQYMDVELIEILETSVSAYLDL